MSLFVQNTRTVQMDFPSISAIAFHSSESHLPILFLNYCKIL